MKYSPSVFLAGFSSFLLFTGYRDPTILVYPIHNGSHVLIRMEARRKCKQNNCLTHTLTMECYVYACTGRLLPNCNNVNVKVYKNNIRYIRNNVIWLLIKINTVWEVPVFDIFLVRIFPHSDWIQRDTQHPSVFTSNLMQHNTDQKNWTEKKEQINITPFSICSTVAPLFLQVIKKN